MTVIAKKLKSRGELPWCKLKKEENKDDSFLQIFRVRKHLLKTFSFTFGTHLVHMNKYALKIEILVVLLFLATLSFIFLLPISKRFACASVSIFLIIILYHTEIIKIPKMLRNRNQNT